MTDWSSAEKDKIWESACDEDGNYQDLTFEQFKALIIGEGGFHLKAKVEGMAATAQAAQIENGAEPVGQELVGLTHGIPSNPSLPHLAPVATGQSSVPLMHPDESGDWETASSHASQGLAVLGKRDGSSQPQGAQSLPVLQEHAKTMPHATASGFDVDPSDNHVRFEPGKGRSNSGHLGPGGAWYGHGEHSDDDDDYDDQGNLQPKLLTKRRTGNSGGVSPELVRSASEGGALRSPGHAPHRRSPYAFVSNAPPVTPNELPSKVRNSPTAAARTSSSNTSGMGTFRDGRNGTSPDLIAEHGFSCSTGQEINDTSIHSGTGASQTEPLVCLQHSVALLALSAISSRSATASVVLC